MMRGRVALPFFLLFLGFSAFSALAGFSVFAGFSGFAGLSALARRLLSWVLVSWGATLVFLHLGVGLGLQLLHDLLGGDHLGGLVIIQGLVHRRGQRVGQIQLAHGNGRLLDDGDFLRRGSRFLKHRGF